MGFKDFIKPTTWKIIITLTLSILFFVYLFSIKPTVACPQIDGYDCSREISEAKEIYFKSSLIFGGIGIIFWYLISCSIIFVYEKLRKNA